MSGERLKLKDIGEMGEWGKEGSWEVKKCLRHFVPFLVLSALRHIQEKMEDKKRRREKVKVKAEVEGVVPCGPIIYACGRNQRRGEE